MVVSVEKDASPSVAPITRRQPLRSKNVGKEHKSPYITRAVDMNVKLTKEEQKIWDYIWGGEEKIWNSQNNTFNIREDIFMTSDGVRADPFNLQSLAPGHYVSAAVIDCWASVLNFDEKYRSEASPKRFFCGSSVILEWMLEDESKGCDANYRKVMFYESMLHALGGCKELLDLKDIDLIFFPIFEEGHDYLVVFELKNPDIFVIDNRHEDATVVKMIDATEYVKKGGPYKVKHIFLEYLEQYSPLKARKLASLSITRLKLKWATKKNECDAGAFMMRHMEVFMGSYKKNFDCGLSTKPLNKTSQINTLRKKYASRILLSDCNLHQKKVFDIISQKS